MKHAGAWNRIASCYAFCVAARLQNIVGVLIIASVFAAGARAGQFAGGPEATFVASEREIAGLQLGGFEGRDPTISAGTTTVAPSGWRASLFVSHMAPQLSLNDDWTRVRPTTFVGARLSRPLSGSLRLSLDLFNIFDRKSPDFDYFANLHGAPSIDTENFLFSPGEPRGFRIRLRKTF